MQIELAELTEVAGIQVYGFCDPVFAGPLRIWVPDGRKEMNEAASAFRELYRYRFDSRNKDIKAKCIRIGREPSLIPRSWLI